MMMMMLMMKFDSITIQLLRFPVMKQHRLGKKKRILYIDTKAAMLHLVIQGKKRKDIPCMHSVSVRDETIPLTNRNIQALK